MVACGFTPDLLVDVRVVESFVHHPPLNEMMRSCECFPHLNEIIIITYTELEEFEDTKGVTIIRKSQKNGQHNGHKKKTEEQTTQWP